MPTSFYRFFLLLIFVMSTAIVSAPEATAKPIGSRFLPSVRAKIKGQNRLHRPVYRTYKSHRAY